MDAHTAFLLTVKHNIQLVIAFAGRFYVSPIEGCDPILELQLAID